ncbi:DEAD/DEAH box helicase [Paenibacillus tyrfis]|uniref:DEAD/DEAH box helicase n=1 Tax=Paenibacillus tyrfis TaxID=1501230 RepID=A0A081P6X8_9BACL|nr:DEAD/DEAH box helicase [Paenibacillus tyrfis]KEQ26451.1 DEAD/DEAH box helicase [Paenibacillus tyrfis]
MDAELPIGFHPLLAAWFGRTFGEPTEVQLRAWESIGSEAHTLIAAPTGSGKTLAALLPCLDRIVTGKAADGPVRGVKLLYVTPLKALNNDIHHHVVGFIDQLERTAAETGMPWPGLTVGVRTGDTTQSTRASMLRQPPDVLVTTPESLYILLTSLKGRDMLRTVRHVIVDEIHDLAEGARGLHLSVTLERLVAWCGRSPQRIGVSATQKPIERVARFLGGWEPAETEGSGADAAQAGTAAGSDDTGAGMNVEAGNEMIADVPMRPRPVNIVESRMHKALQLVVTMPEQTFITQDKQEAVWGPVTERLVKLMEGSRSVLIFANNRRLCERLTLRLNDHVGYEMARSHHGSVSREQRLEVERALKAGELRCLVATSSLELGIDVGHIDLVVQIDSPKSAAAGIQRIGRAGHSVGGVSRGIILARSRGQLPECAVLSRRVLERDIEEIRIPVQSLDVLCQQIAAMVAGDDWTIHELARVLAGSYGYRDFPRQRLLDVLQVLSGYYPFVRPLLDWNRDTGVLSRRGVTGMAAIMGAGTIPQSSAYPVHHADSRVHIGELDEEYIHESRVGDVFQLGTSSWKIQSIKNDRVYVVEAGNRFSEIPFWRGEGQGRTFELSRDIGRFMDELERRLEQEETYSSQDWLTRDYGLDVGAAGELIALIRSQKAVSAVPTHRRIVIERFRDELKQWHVIVHSTFGRTFNRTWLLALRQHGEERFPVRLFANAKDNGIHFVLSGADEGMAASFVAMLRGVTSVRLEALLREAVPSSPQFGAAFRRLAETSLLLSRSFTRTPAWKKRLRSEELLRESLPYAERFPFLGEAMRICLQEELDMPRVREALEQIEAGALEVNVRESLFPSPLAAAFLTEFMGAQIYESDAVGKDIQLQLLGLERAQAGRLFGESPVLEAGQPDRGAAEEEPWLASAPMEQPETLLRLLKQRGDRTAAEMARLAADSGAEEAQQQVEEIGRLLRRLEEEGRVRLIDVGGEKRWICSDEADTYARFADDPLAVRFVLTRYMEHRASFTVEELATRYGAALPLVDDLVSQWAADGTIEPAFGESEAGPRTWVSRETAARRIRRAERALREQAAPVDPVRYCRYLMAAQHVLPGSRLSGEEGLRDVIGKLQGWFLPLPEWEASVFPLRLTDYRKETLDRLCAAGEVIWIGRKEQGEKEGRVAFFLAEAKELYAPLLKWGAASKHEPLLELLRRKGASFLSALSRETGSVPSELTVDLIELAWEGLVSNDQFAPLRMNGSGRKTTAKSTAKFQSGLGRWYALETLVEEQPGGADSLGAWVKQALDGSALLTRDLAGTLLPWSWDDVYGSLKQLELWGMLTRGFWVQEIAAMQFAAPETVGHLREAVWEAGGGETVLLPAADPANPFGLTVRWPSAPGVAFARKPGNDLVFRGGRWVLWCENNGRRMHTLHALADATEEAWLPEEERLQTLRAVLQSYLKKPGVRKVVIDTWNGVPVLDTPAAGTLRQLGAEADRASLVLWPSSLR